MRKMTRFSMLALVLAAAAALAIPSSHAACVNSHPIIGQPGGTAVTFGAAGADGAPQDGVSPIQAAYWRLTAGNPTVGTGADNGSWGNDAANGGPWFFDATAAGDYITAGLTDGDGTSDGCINGADDAGGGADDKVLLAACAPDGKFVVLGATNADGSVFDFGNGPYTPANSPQLVITNSVKGGTGVTISFTTPTAASFAGSYVDNTAGGIPIASVFTGVNVYHACVPRGNGAPARLVPNAAWVSHGSFALNTASSVAVDCGSGAWDVFTGVEPKFDGATPFTAGCVTGTTRPVQAGSTLATPGDNPTRTIKKPRGIRQSDPN